jgi:outer membrane protein assembly factor BamD (BamD/ComL family)
MRKPIRVPVFISFAACIALTVGCAALTDTKSSDPSLSLGPSSRPNSSRNVVRASFNDADSVTDDEAVAKKSLKTEDFYPANFGTTVKRLTGKGPDPDIARRLYGEGEELYRQAMDARSRDAQEEGRDLLLDASDRFSGAAARWPDSALAEDALFRAGESQFFADRYVKANELFEELLKDYPNSRYLDLIGARRFLIAQYWFEMDAGSTDGTLGVNLTKDTHPWSDTFGHAVRIFDRMRLDDPTGKLADDATIAAANAYFQKEDYLKADQYYSDLRTHFPSSEHQFMAHFLGIKAKLLGYRGPEFTGESLDEAETLIKQVRRQFPTESREHQDEIDKAFSEVRYRKAEREWLMAQYYDRRKEYGAARFYYDLLNEDYGDTPFADKARDRVGNIAGKPRTPPQRLAWLVNLFPDGGKPQPMIATAPGDSKLR